MSLTNTIMYFQNTLLAIEEMKTNDINYALLYKYILRQHILST